jgi:arabinose-5-phosphate isomerase
MTSTLQLLQQEIMHLSNAVQYIENNDNIKLAVDIMYKSLLHGSKILFTGVGKNVYLCHKLSATFASLNLNASYFDVTHGMHGDLGMLRPNDTIVAFSKSGNTAELLHTLKYVHDNNEILNVNIILVTQQGIYDVSKCEFSTIDINLPAVQEIDEWSLVPTTSALLFQAFGDAIAINLSQRFGLIKEHFIFTHPGGAIGQTK